MTLYAILLVSFKYRVNRTSEVLEFIFLKTIRYKYKFFRNILKPNKTVYMILEESFLIQWHRFLQI